MFEVRTRLEDMYGQTGESTTYRQGLDKLPFEEIEEQGESKALRLIMYYVNRSEYSILKSR